MTNSSIRSREQPEINPRIIHRGPKKRVESYEGEAQLVLVQPPSAHEERKHIDDYFDQWPATDWGLQWVYVACRFIDDGGYIAIVVEPGEKKYFQQSEMGRIARSLKWWGFALEFYRWCRPDEEDRGFLIASLDGKVKTEVDVYLIDASESPGPTEVWRHIIETWSELGDLVLNPLLKDCRSAKAAHDREFVGICHDPIANEIAHKELPTGMINAMEW